MLCWCSTRDKALIWLRTSAARSNSSASEYAIICVCSVPITSSVLPSRKRSALLTSRP